MEARARRIARGPSAGSVPENRFFLPKTGFIATFRGERVQIALSARAEVR
jgi:hypothetical protein